MIPANANNYTIPVEAGGFLGFLKSFAAMLAAVYSGTFSISCSEVSLRFRTHSIPKPNNSFNGLIRCFDMSS